MASAGPVSEGDRIVELDVLRGVALFGVLLMNFVGFVSAGIVTTDAQLAALPTARVDEWVNFGVLWLVGDKANTMFATLFGLGFYLQMKRGEDRPGFEARYSRRLFWLLIFGWLNATLLWVWDILNVYAVAGFLLLLMRNWKTRSLVIFGAIAALYTSHVQDWWLERLGIDLVPDSLYEPPAILARQSTLLTGDYPQLVSMMWQWTYSEWLAGGMLVGWIVYALGRFALGAAIGRSGILDDIKGHLPTLRRVTRVALPLGLLLALLARLWDEDIWLPFDGAGYVGEFLRSPAALILAAGYSAGIVIALRQRWGARWFGLLAPVGQMALTNYLMQGLIYAFVLFGVGPGLGMAGRIGASSVTVIAVVFFAFQIVFSYWWLARYRFGPMEWVWRTLTYGQAPQMRRTAENFAI
jgi:uncharacterized protein